LVENFKKTLRHTDPMVLDEFGTSLAFVDVYLSTLDNQDTTIHTSVPTQPFLVPRALARLGCVEGPGGLGDGGGEWVGGPGSLLRMQVSIYTQGPDCWVDGSVAEGICNPCHSPPVLDLCSYISSFNSAENSFPAFFQGTEKCTGWQIRRWDFSPGLPLSSCVTLDKSLRLTK
jgi:hypothetical protein